MGNSVADLVKKPHIIEEFTQEQILEYRKCYQDPIYFMETYVKVQHPAKGVVPFKLYDYQHKIVDALQNNRDVVLLLSRQSGKTLTVAVFLLWESIFFEDKTMLIASKNFAHAVEIMDRLKYAYEELPRWLKPGVIFYNRMSVKFDNNSLIKSEGTTEKTGRGLSITRVYCLGGETQVSIRNKHTGKIENINLVSLYNRLENETE